MTFFAGRWVPAPDHVSELGGNGLPAGFRASGVAAQIKESGAPTWACWCATPGGHERRAVHRLGHPGAAGAAVSRALPPGRAAGGGRERRQRQRRHRPAGPRQCRQDAGERRDGRARARGPGRGVLDRSHRGSAADGQDQPRHPGGRARTRRRGAGAFAAAIQTTDAFDKRAALEVRLPSGTVTITAQAKGAGMISPGFATLLVFVQSDAALAAQTGDLLLGCASSAHSSGSRSTASCPPTIR